MSGAGDRCGADRSNPDDLTSGLCPATGRAAAARGVVLLALDDVAAAAGAGQPGRPESQEARPPRGPALPAGAPGGGVRARPRPADPAAAAGGGDPRRPKKTLRGLGDPPDPRRHRQELVSAVAELAPAVGTQAAGRALEVSRATVYRRRQPPPAFAPPPPPPPGLNAPQRPSRPA